MPKQWQWQRLRRRLPILIIGAAALIGALTLRDQLSFDALAQALSGLGDDDVRRLLAEHAHGEVE